MRELARKIGRYRVNAELGRGTMGVVYLAHDPVLGRDVALKTISYPPGFSEREREHYRHRFLREARAAGRLSHPAIVTVYDFDESADGGQPHLAMEFVPGRSLKQILEEDGPGSPDQALAMVDAVAAALEVAHDGGVVHRDIKPANILIRETDGAVKITDFGVARMPFSELTVAGSTVGSPAYMAPERFRGQRADARSDLFSLAMILYESLCGERPFHGEDTVEVTGAIAHHSFVPITRRVRNLPESLDSFLLRALAKEPGERFPDATCFRKALAAVRRELRGESSAPEPERAGEHTVLLAPEPAERPRRMLPAPFAGPGWTLPKLQRVHWLSLGALMLAVASFGLGRVSLGPVPGPAKRAERPAPAPEIEAPGSAPTEVATPIPVVGAPPAAVAKEGSPPSPPEARSAASSESAAAPTRTPPPTTRPERTPPVAESRPESTAPKAARKTPRPRPEPAAAAPSEVVAEEPSPPSAPAPVASSPAAPAAVEPATLLVRVRTSVREGVLTLVVDGETLLSEELSNDKKNLFFKKIAGRGREEFERSFEIAAGAHTVVARLEVEGKDRSHEETLFFEAEPGATRELEVKAGRTLLGRPLTVDLR